MRQAGRYQPEYRELRRRHSLLEIAGTPSLAAEVTCLPVERYGMDAAILFSDIMVPLGPAGIRYEIREGVGPVVAEPIRQARDLERLHPIDPARDLPEVAEAIRRITRRLGDIPLIGFAGAPFTLASYLVEGRPSRDYLETKRLMWTDPPTWTTLMERLAEIVVAHARAQVAAGARAIQIFDSWAGALAPADYERAVLPTMRRIFAALADTGVPRIYFGVGTGGILPLMREAGADVLGVDWRVRLPEVRRRLGPDVPLQGNLDPAVLLQPWPVVEREATRILEEMDGDPAFIFNLGHGVLPATDPDNVRRLVNLVHGAAGTEDGHHA
jgi:uroporphyrinogen decarboxylase